MTPFKKFLKRELLPAAAEVERLDRPDRLTGPAFVAEALANARTTRARVAELRAQIEQATDLSHLQAFVRRVVTAFTAATLSDGTPTGRYPRPPRQHLGAFGHEDAVIGQSAILKSNPVEFVAVAALIATEKSPASFGSIKDWPEYVRQQTAARELLRVLDARLLKELNLAEDATFDDNGRPTLKFTAGEVAVHPLSNLGERLRGWLHHHPNALNGE